jgi:anaerobic magnesium-protoporphyrin IX monomethyl ester cyclase
MANVLLIQPPVSVTEMFARGSKSSASVIPPLGLAYLAAYLRRAGHNCRILDGAAEPQPVAAIAELASRFDLAGITIVSAYALPAIELLQAIKHRCPKLPVVVGGPHVTALPESLLSCGADYAVVGEGEATLLELVETLAAGGKEDRMMRIAGLVSRQDGKAVFGGTRPRLAPLDCVPLPARDLLPMHRYRSSIARASAQPSHSLLTSRGCPGVCSFCSKLTFGTQVRYFSAERILEEFFLLRDRYGARDIAVWDDNFVSNEAVVLSVCDKLRSGNLGISWSVEARVDGVSRPILEELKRAGCTYIAYGIESGSQRVLDHINKKITLERIRETVRQTKEAGLAIRAYFIIGFPEETLAEMEETVRFALELDVEVASFTLWIPLPGTVEYNRARESGRFDPEYFLKRVTPEFNFPDAPIYVPVNMTARQLMDMHRRAYNRYYFRPKMLWRKLSGIRSCADALAIVQAGRTLLTNALVRRGGKQGGGTRSPQR